MRLLMLLFCSLLTAGAARAENTRTAPPVSADFDYYVLALSWSPNWCALTGDSRGDAQCDQGLGLTFTLHGLWPEREDGSYPSACRTTARDPSRHDTAAMADIMGSSGLAWHEWKEHGRCSGLSSDDWLAMLRKAYASVTIPPLFAKVKHPLQVAPRAIEDAFLEANPELSPASIAVTCEADMIQEVRICLTTDLSPRPCATAIRACTLPAAELDAVR